MSTWEIEVQRILTLLLALSCLSLLCGGSAAIRLIRV